MNLQSRIVPGSNNLRPQPFVFQGEDKQTLAVITTWGSSAVEQTLIERIKSVMTPLPLPKKGKREPPIEAKLAQAIKAANDDLMNGENLKTWNVVMEVMVLHFSKGVLHWAQVGLPHLLLSKQPDQVGEIEILSVSIDPSAVLPEPVPLPLVGIGLDPYPSITFGSVGLLPGSKIGLLSVGNRVLPNLGQTALTLPGLMDVISTFLPQQPAWIGLVEP